MSLTSSPLLINSPLKLGNSDPFHTYAITIGPREFRTLQVYQKYVVPCLYKSYSPETVDAVIHTQRLSFVGLLQDEVTAYALLSREAALETLLSRKSNVAVTSHLSLIYMTKCQAVLRGRLSLIDGSETPDTVVRILCTILRLTAAEAMIDSQNAHLHIHALKRLFTRYSQLVGSDLDNKVTADLLALMHADVCQALRTSGRPILDMKDWFPYLNHDRMDARSLSPSSGEDMQSESEIIHRDVKDQVLRSAIRRQRKTLLLYHESLKKDLDSKVAGLLSSTLEKEIYQQIQLLNITANAEEVLRTPGLGPEQLHNQCAQAYLSFSVLLWSRRTLPTSILTNLLLDMASPTLRRLKNIIMIDKIGQRTHLHRNQSYADARLWALSVGIYTELQSRETSGISTICGDWFLETFRDEARAMHVHTWQHAVMIFERFLYSDRIQPHISRWWNKVVHPE